jgi:hypothetical protein
MGTAWGPDRMLSPRLADATTCPGCQLIYGRPWRPPAIWSDTSFWAGDVHPFLSRPIPGPEIPAGSPSAPEDL